MVTVLYIDDDDDAIRELAVDIFNLKNISVRAAANGEEGLRILAEESIDIIFTDYHMPKMSGYEFCQAVRKDERYNTVPIVGVGDFSQREEREHLVRCIEKPFNIDDLLNSVREYTKTTEN